MKLRLYWYGFHPSINVTFLIGSLWKWRADFEETRLSFGTDDEDLIADGIACSIECSSLLKILTLSIALSIRFNSNLAYIHPQIFSITSFFTPIYEPMPDLYSMYG
jgi:hypothetical protein